MGAEGLPEEFLEFRAAVGAVRAVQALWVFWEQTEGGMEWWHIVVVPCSQTVPKKAGWPARDCSFWRCADTCVLWISSAAPVVTETQKVLVGALPQDQP